MIAKTEAIVLKSMKFRDTSKIVTFYTRSFGKLKAVAKGARETKSKFGAALEPMTRVSLVIYKKQNRDLQLISQCDILDVHKKVHSEMERMSIGLAMIELLERVTHDEEENAGLFSLISDCLTTLDNSEKHYRSVLPAFELQMASRLGFAPSLELCVSCGKALKGFEGKDVAMFLVPQGAVVCPNCMKHPRERGQPFLQSLTETHEARVETFDVLRNFQDEHLASVPFIEYDESVGNEIDETLRLYLRHHFDDSRTLKSTAVFQKILFDTKGG